MNYEESLAYLASLNRFGINLGLARIEKLLKLMGNPERQYKTVHVTGSNGKGSTTAMITSILRESGIKTGMYTSPHLVEYTERMLVNGEEISRGDFAAAIEHTKRHVDIVTAGGMEHPTQFEVITAAAFYYFAQRGVEYAVVEVGLGGLLDSTNVIVPAVAVITNVSMEHTDKCGNTLAEIAAHKAGIIKHGVPVVTGASGEALEVIRDRAAANHAPLYRLGSEFFSTRVSKSLNGQCFIWTSGDQRLGPFTLGLLGNHQVDNAALAIMTAELLGQTDSRISNGAIDAGLKAAVWPGRFEIFTGSPTIIIDGAHNPDSARVLREALDEYFPQKSITFVLGILKDKDIYGVIRSLVRQADHVITVLPVSERAADPVEVAGIVRSITAAQEVCSLDKAIAAAVEAAGPHGIVCITGSLYLVGPARELVSR